MKYSTQNNFKELIRQELVNRFENVVQDEIKRHNIAVEKSNSDMSVLLSEFKEHKKLLEKILQDQNKQQSDLKKDYESKIKEIGIVTGKQTYRC